MLSSWKKVTIAALLGWTAVTTGAGAQAYAPVGNSQFGPRYQMLSGSGAVDPSANPAQPAYPGTPQPGDPAAAYPQAQPGYPTYPQQPGYAPAAVPQAQPGYPTYPQQPGYAPAAVPQGQPGYPQQPGYAPAYPGQQPGAYAPASYPVDASAFPGAPVPGAYGAGVPAGYAPAAGTPSKKLNLSKLALGLLGGYLAAPKQSLTTTALFAANSMLNSNPFSGIGGLGNSLAPQQPMTEDQAVQYLRQLYPYRSDQEIWAAMQILRGQ